jgi:hypothetical protein
MAVYQGVLSIGPGGASEGVLEIGNSGRDIAGTQDIYIRPSNIGGANESSSNFAKFYSDTGNGAGRTSLTIPGTINAGNLTMAAQNSEYEGGEVVLNAASGTSYRQWHIDAWQNQFRLFTAPNSPTDGPTFVIDSNNGYVWVAQPNAKLCFYGGDCHTWSDMGGGSVGLNDVLATNPVADGKTAIFRNSKNKIGVVITSATAGDAPVQTENNLILTSDYEFDGAWTGAAVQGDSVIAYGKYNQTGNGLALGPWASGVGSNKGLRVDGAGHLLVYDQISPMTASLNPTNFGSLVISRPGGHYSYIAMRNPTYAWGLGMGANGNMYIGNVLGSATNPTFPSPALVLGTNGRLGTGGTIQPMAQLAVNNNLTSSGSQFDSIGTYNNNGGSAEGTQGSAIYAQQNNIMGYAGYYSGSVKIVGGASTNPSVFVPHYTLEVRNSSGIGNSPNAMMITGGDSDSTGYDSVALSIVAGRAGISSPSSNKTYGLIVQRGYGQGSSYAALFIGKIMKKTSSTSSRPGEVPTLQWAVGGTSCTAECGYSGQECWLAFNKPTSSGGTGAFNSCDWTTTDRLCFCNNPNSASYGGL